ncbi:hypothetical protein [Devosia sp.]|uniref:hypothetical protein n=1 Tax=Devosia sp. TaxID=1871048 RepID=UPI003A8ED484
MGLPAIDPQTLGPVGLIAILPLPILAAYVLIIVGFVSSLGEALVTTRWPLFFLVSLILLLHATPAISYETLRYSWAWKHIGVIDYIMRTGHIDQSARFLSAYHNWPGFFIFFATIGNLFRLDALQIADLARFSPTVLNLAYLAVLPLLFSNFTADRRIIWAGTGVFLLGNWVGQDYFSPQGVALLFYLSLLALATGPLSQRAVAALVTSDGTPLKRPLFWGAPATQPKAKYLPLALLLIIAITVTHQLTPLFVLAALFALFVIGRLSPGFFIFALVAELAWLLYFATPFVAPILGELVAEFGAVGTGTVERLVDLEIVSDGQRIVSLASRGLTLAIAAAGALGMLVRWLGGYRDVTVLALLFAPMPLLVATPYGGEIAFRLYLFALPLLSFFAANLFFAESRPVLGRGASRLGLFALVLIALVPGFILANNGKDQQYWFSTSEIEAANWLYTNSTPGQLLIEGSRNYPSQFRNYENFIYVPLVDELPEIEEPLVSAPDVMLARWLSESEHGGYIIITDSQKALFDSLGVLPPGGLQRIETALLASPLLKLAYSTRDTSIFTLAGAGR